MKRFVGCLITVAMLSGCGDRGAPSAAYRDWGDRMAVATGLRDLGLVRPCSHHVRNQYGDYDASTPDEECYRFDAPKRWKGLWLAEFEGSIFCPEPAKTCTDGDGGPYVWLGFGKQFKPPPGLSNNQPGAVLYAVDLIGRRSSFKGYYGHMGGAESEILVDKFISVTPVGFEVPPPAEADLNSAKARKAGRGSRPG